MAPLEMMLPAVPEDVARVALNYVGADPYAEAIWVQAINDPRLGDEARQNLIEDLNENGFADPKKSHPRRIAADRKPPRPDRNTGPRRDGYVNSAAFQEAYKDLTKHARKTGGTVSRA